MKVIVDTSVWSLALRRRKTVSSHPKVLLLKNLIVEDDVILLGVVRQEILSGIRHQNQYEQLKQTLRAFPDFSLQVEDYELASEFYNICRSHGIQGSNTDFLICAVGVYRDYPILTADQDFEHFCVHIPLKLI